MPYLFTMLPCKICLWVLFIGISSLAWSQKSAEQEFQTYLQKQFPKSNPYATWLFISPHPCQYCYTQTLDALRRCALSDNVQLVWVGQHKTQAFGTPSERIFLDPQQQINRTYGQSSDLFIVKNSAGIFEHIDLVPKNIEQQLVSLFNCNLGNRR
jgi:hypothetical protein